jgi:hypothetical protein
MPTGTSWVSDATPDLSQPNERYQVFRWERDVECLLNEADPAERYGERRETSAHSIV